MKEIDFLKKIVKQASLLITPEFEVKSKGDNGDLVTNFDYEIEQYLISEIKKEFPNFGIVSEEFNTNAKLLQNCFVIDPIDGTINFANGLPLWAIQIACIKNGETIASVISIPRLSLFYYADETGTYLNDKKVFVNNLPPEKSLYDIQGLEKKGATARMTKYSMHLRDFWSSAVSSAFVSNGYLGGFVLKGDNVWDYIPGQYLVKQAGGFIINKEHLHISANSKEFAEILLKKVGNYENDTAITPYDNI